MAERRYIEGTGWRYDTEHSMHRRLAVHDYSTRCIYMLTLCVEGRVPILGELRAEETAHIVPTELGREVVRCWQEIPMHYPEVELRDFQLMPDHIHGLLFVTRDMEAHLGQIVKGFKIGCTKALWKLEDEGKGKGAAGRTARAAACSAFCSADYNPPHLTEGPHLTGGQRLTEGASQAGGLHQAEGLGRGQRAKAPQPAKRAPLFEAGYQDSVLTGKDQLEHMVRYIKDNPRRLAMKRQHPDLFRVVSSQEIEGMHFAAIGNRWLAERPVRLQVRCHNNTSPINLELIARQKAYFLERASKGAVIVSPCISAGEKEIARAALDAGYPLIVILENGFPPMYKPPGQYFEACCQGRLLMLAPWPYHMEKHTITRSQCQELNEMARRLSTEPWDDGMV